MQTLLLDTLTWDLVWDVTGNIAVASDPYSLAQDAASAIKAFLTEVYYDKTKGVPYWQNILGRSPSLSYVKGQLVVAAKTVPGVVSAIVFVRSWTERRVTGQVQITDSAGNTATANF